MPAIWKRAVEKIKQGSPGVNPYAVATASLQKAGDLKPGTRTATKKGLRRGAMSEAQRHKTPAKAMTISGKVKRPHLGRAGRT
jgi:hypothetical protein